MFFLLAFNSQVYVVYSKNVLPEDSALIKKYEQWKEVIANQKNYRKVFSFFYKNPDWPMFSQIVKLAEQNIDLKNLDEEIILKWFKRYSPTTSNGLLAYSSCLLKADPDLGKKYIDQIWKYQNLSPECLQIFRKKFARYISPISDAKRAKMLLSKKDYKQLKAMINIIPTYIAEYIINKITPKNIPDIHNADDRYRVAKVYIKLKEYKKAAAVLMADNSREEIAPVNFFNIRREVACNMARGGYPLLAYSVMSMHKLNRFHPHQKKNYVKAEWLSGFFAFRFLNDKKNGLTHFKNAYSSSDDVLHKSKNAFWIAETYSSMNNAISAFEWYKKTYEYFNTFYGILSIDRLKGISAGRFLMVNYGNKQIIIEKSIKNNFDNRELVKVLRVINKYNVKTSIKLLSAIYKKLVDDIDDPKEETLLMNLTSTKEESDLLIKYEETKQKYLRNTKSFKILNENAIKYVEHINPNKCFISLVHSVIKRESMFNPTARSYAGAIGLMQIMPSTASFIMKSMNFYVGEKKTPLYDVQKNLTIGAYLLNYLLEKYNNNLVYALYAYNAGEGNLKKFLKSIMNLKEISLLDLIELIPIKETRLYIKNVLANMFAYVMVFGVEPCYGRVLQPILIKSFPIN
ncbi:MAG: lytic transglycosylase domain-containing protein [Holosporales bacterium]|jgi:soluble lytic murein transglycosylase|nr:lytic transglycosylase domain-containing protein [Holosporales bacterium]